jgi:hypothetical protein
MSEDENTCRIQRDELLGLLDTSTQEQRITARMPAVTLDMLLSPEDVPPPLAVTFRPTGTDRMPRIDSGPIIMVVEPGGDDDGVVTNDGIISDDIDPEVSVAMGAITSNALNATLDAAIDAACTEAADEAINAAVGEDTALIVSTPPRVDPPPPHFIAMLFGFALTLLAGFGVIILIS